jgi:hypothetical protein
MHNLLNQLKISTFPFFTFQLTPVSIQPKLASQQPITFAIALEGRLEQNYLLNEGKTTMVVLLDRRNAKRNGCDWEIT